MSADPAWDAWAKPLAAGHRKTASLLRACAKAAFPDADESLRTSAKMQYVQYKDASGIVCMITPEPQHVKLMMTGIPKPVPGLLIEGTGKGMRHVKSRSADQVDKKAIAALLSQVRT